MDKPAGPTSHDVVARVRRIFHTRAVGHTGTLDPFATGLLVLLEGRATRLARFVEQQAKTYLATAKLGVATTTDDLTGEPIVPSADGTAGRRDDSRAADDRVTLGAAEPRPGSEGEPSRRAVEDTLAGLLGPQRQRPPVFSAKQVGGERSYAKARRGEAVELAEVDIVVHRLELVAYDWPGLTFRTTVSPGTYVRVLAREIAERLGTTAHLVALRREAIGPLKVEQAVGLESLTDATPMLPPLAVLGHLRQVAVSEADRLALGYGRAVPLPVGDVGKPDANPVALTFEGRLIAIAAEREGMLQPEVVLEVAG